MDSFKTAWLANKERLIKLAYKNTFLAISTAFENGWDLAMEEAERRLNVSLQGTSANSAAENLKHSKDDSKVRAGN